MASVSASYHFADGERVDVDVEVENDYPDALHEASKTCTDTLVAAIKAGLAEAADEDTDQG